MSEPTKYRKKPVVIEAMHWNGTAEGATPIINWILDNGDRAARYHEAVAPVENDAFSMPGSPEYLEIDTLEGTMRADVGDYIIRGVQNEFYPCKPDIFKETYEIVL